VPAESRTITFTGPEVMEALVDYCRRMKRPVPTGTITPVILAGRKESRIAFEGGGKPARVTFYEAELAAALIAYCKKRRIPVSRGSDKRLQFTPDTVMLHLRQGGPRIN